MTLKSVQRWAMKCIKGLKDKEHRCRLQSLKLPTLTYRQYSSNMIMTYKLLQSENKDMFEPAWSSSTRGHSAKLFGKHARTRKRNNFFYNRIIGMWNSLSERTIESQQGLGDKTGSLNRMQQMSRDPIITNWHMLDSSILLASAI